MAETRRAALEEGENRGDVFRFLHRENGREGPQEAAASFLRTERRIGLFRQQVLQSLAAALDGVLVFGFVKVFQGTVEKPIGSFDLNFPGSGWPGLSFLAHGRRVMERERKRQRRGGEGAVSPSNPYPERRKMREDISLDTALSGL